MKKRFKKRRIKSYSIFGLSVTGRSYREAKKLANRALDEMTKQIKNAKMGVNLQGG